MNNATPGNEIGARTGTPWDTAAEALGGRVFHIGIEIDGNITDCVLIDPAAPGSAMIYRTAKALSGRAIPADRVMAGLAELAEAAGLGQRELLARTTRFCPGTGMAQLEHKLIRIQVIRSPGPRQNQQALWRKFLAISREPLDRPGHPRHAGYRKQLGCGSRTRSTLSEGLVSLLTEIVWSDVLPRVSDPASGTSPGAECACEPSPGAGQVPRLGYDRYVVMAELVRLLHVAGSARNVFAAFLLGEVEKVTGPVSLAVLGTPWAPLPIEEVAALVARLSAVPAAERQRLRISLFAGAPQDEIERLLAEPGADVLAVWIASARPPTDASGPAQTWLSAAAAALPAP